MFKSMESRITLLQLTSVAHTQLGFMDHVWGDLVEATQELQAFGSDEVAAWCYWVSTLGGNLEISLLGSYHVARA